MRSSAVLAEKPLENHRRWTYAQLCAELEENNRFAELWRGRLIMSPSPTPFHQAVAQRLESLLRNWVERRKLGFVFDAPLDVVLAPDIVLQPDVFFIAKTRRSIIKNHIAGAPDLVVEVVSPEHSRRDYKDKKNLYEAYGVREYWIIDPARGRIEVWTLLEDFFQLAGAYTGQQFAASALLPGFKVQVAKIMAEAW